jgi:hypothetical protein
MSSVAFPFELPNAPEPFFVEIPPILCSVMNSGSVAEKKAIALIAPHLIQFEGEWGVQLPMRFGFSLAERTELIESQKIDRETMKATLKIFSEIAAETGKTLEEIQLAAQKAESGEGVEWFLPYAERLLSIDMATTPASIVECTLFMKRLIPKWATSNTLALHPKILSKLFDMRESEQGDIEDLTVGEATEDLQSSVNE